jgi:hypothetical protein
MPKSRPWHAPEHIFLSSQYTLVQAKKMDIFSFGMLCFWLMFEQYLSMNIALPPEASWAEQYLQDSSERGQSLPLLDELKNKDSFLLLSELLTAAQHDLDGDQQQALSILFNSCLRCKPDERASDLRQTFGRFIPEEYVAALISFIEFI